VVLAGEALAECRRGLTGQAALDQLVKANGRLLEQLPVGVGKTEMLIDTIAAAAASGYDLVVALVPRWDVLHEVLARLRARGVKPLVLTPRPRNRCGPLDAAWTNYERQGCALAGREDLCTICPRRRRCPWPGQYRRLRGARLVLTTQAHLTIDPLFVRRIRQLAGARRPLVLLDESDFLVRSGERIIAGPEFDRFLAAQRAALQVQKKKAGAARRWLELTELVAGAPTTDLQGGGWDFPAVGPRWALAVQHAGRLQYGDGFRFLGHELHAFAGSDRGSRERLPDGGLRFAVPPALGDEFIVFSGSIAPELVRYRIDPSHRDAPIASPFAGLRFGHPETRWYNIADMSAAAANFPGNAGRILDFFAEKVARNVRDGKRTLLVCRKKFRRLCVQGLRARLGRLGVGPVRVVTGGWARHDLTDPRTLPLITYGISGVNIFQDFDAAYCLTGYYTTADAVAQAVHDIEASPERYPVRLELAGRPPRRRARVELPDGRETIVPRIAELVLAQKEADVVVQAVGRVRPFTRPREVITFHAGELPGVHYHVEFSSLAAARDFFGVATEKQADIQRQAAQALKLKAAGCTNRQIAAALDVSLATVKRYIRRGGGSNPHI
jgi:hypothetical protein